MLLIDENKLIEIFMSCDDFCKKFDHMISPFTCPRHPHSQNRPGLADSEVMAILIVYHFSGSKCFQYYYQHAVLTVLKPYFPKVPSYNRFVELQGRVAFLLWVYLQVWCKGNEDQGLFYVDSKKLPVCHNRRIHQHRVFKGLAKRGKSSTGWFFGFKLFVIINTMGEIIRVCLTPANVADNNFAFLLKFLRNLKGKLFGDRGFISQKVFEKLFGEGLQLITGLRRNMKNKLIEMTDKLLLKKRGIIESIFDILMTVGDIDHRRHRSPKNALANLFAGLAAYSFYERKPKVFSNKLTAF